MILLQLEWGREKARCADDVKFVCLFGLTIFGKAGTFIYGSGSKVLLN